MTRTTRTDEIVAPRGRGDVPRDQIETFARFVIGEGYGAKAPGNRGSERFPKYETWQETGRRLFGPVFLEVLRGELERQKIAPFGGEPHAAALQRDKTIGAEPEPGHEDGRGEDERGKNL
jgi:hypothetical protein